MAEKTVTLRLKAVTDQYKRSMQDASAATTGLVSKAGGVEKLGGKMRAVGGTLTRSVTLPLALAGAGAVKMSMDFEQTFSRMVGLAGVAAGEVDGLKDSVLSLAGETTRPPAELAEALYFIRSAGLDGQDALDALEMSAKAAAAGLGDTVTVADAVTSAMNAYGAETLSASEATDVLAATAEQGKVEASALAGQFGRLLPVASELGVSFDQVGGAMGYLTRTSGSAELAATQLGGVLSKMLVPAEQGSKALEAIGWSSEDLRKRIADNGLLQTVEDLRNALEANGMELSDFAADQQFVQGALSLTGEKFNDAAETIDAVGDSAGKTDEAFAAFAETAGFKNAQAFAKLQSALIKVGDALVPLVAQGAEFLSVFLEIFDTLPGPIQTTVIAFAGLLAASGPLLSIGGKIAMSWTVLGGVFDKAAISAYNASASLTTMAAAAGKLLLVAGAALLAFEAVKKFGEEMDEAAANGEAMADRIIGSFDAEAASADELNERIGFLVDQHNKLAQRGNEATQSFKVEGYHKAAEAVGAEADAMKELRDRAIVLRDELGLTSDEALKLARNEDVVAAATDELTGEIDANAAALEVEQQAIDETVGAWNALSDALSAQFDPLFAAQDATIKLGDAQIAAAEAAKEFGADSDEAAAANRDVAKAALDNEQAQIDLRAALTDGSVTLDQAKGKLQEWVDQGVFTEDQARQMGREFDVAAYKANAMPDVTPNVELTGYELTIARLNHINDVARSVTGGKLGVDVRKLDAGRASGGPVRAGGTYLVGEEGPEILQMSGNGYVHSNTDSMAALSSLTAMTPMSGGSSSVFAPNISVVARTREDAQAVGQATVDALRAWTRNNGPLPASITS